MCQDNWSASKIAVVTYRSISTGAMATESEEMDHDDDGADELEADSEDVWTYVSKERVFKDGQQTNNSWKCTSASRATLTTRVPRGKPSCAMLKSRTNGGFQDRAPPVVAYLGGNVPELQRVAVRVLAQFQYTLPALVCRS
eukprot:jgi/Mesvir1/28492/Mv15905-RA.1